VNYDVSAIAVKENSQAPSPYSMFKYSIRSEATRKYYERGLRKFLDFIQFKSEISDIEKRCNDFAEQASQTQSGH
jgi:hypothetical protein